jgi:hypothetical protein
VVLHYFDPNHSSHQARNQIRPTIAAGHACSDVEESLIQLLVNLGELNLHSRVRFEGIAYMC